MKDPPAQRNPAPHLPQPPASAQPPCCRTAVQPGDLACTCAVCLLSACCSLPCCSPCASAAGLACTLHPHALAACTLAHWPTGQPATCPCLSLLPCCCHYWKQFYTLAGLNAALWKLLACKSARKSSTSRPAAQPMYCCHKRKQFYAISGLNVALWELLACKPARKSSTSRPAARPICWKDHGRKDAGVGC